MIHFRTNSGTIVCFFLYLVICYFIIPITHNLRFLIFSFLLAQCSCGRFICNQRNWDTVGLLLAWRYRMRRIFHHFIHTMHLLDIHLRKHWQVFHLVAVKLHWVHNHYSIVFVFFVYLTINWQLYDHLIKFHHEKLRMNGYHEFYRATSLHKGIPLMVVSLWNTVILGIQTIMQHQYGPEFFDHCTKQGLFSPTAYIVMFSVLESTILIGAHSFYISKVMNFNRATLPPDAYRGLSESLSSVRTKCQHWFTCEIII